MRTHLAYCKCRSTGNLVHRSRESLKTRAEECCVIETSEDEGLEPAKKVHGRSWQSLFGVAVKTGGI